MVVKVTHVTELILGNQAGYTSVKMTELGHLTWLSAKMVAHLTSDKMVGRSPDLSQNSSSHMLYGKATIFELQGF